MTGDRRKRIEDLFIELCDLDPGLWEARLDGACRDQPELRGEVLSLLREDRSTNEFLPTSDAGPEARLTRLLKSMPSEAAPRTIGDYRILGVLGRGSQGIVYEAEQARPHRRVAVKVRAVGLGQDRDRRRFEREAEILGRMHHPGIAQIHEWGMVESEGLPQPYLVLELVEGKPLSRWADEQRLGLVARLELFVRVCAGVQHAHQQGVIHRDLKPSNILVADSGQPKILDFGIARSLSVDALQSLEGAAVIGTLAYMSPEQAQGKTDELDTRTDVHALGVILHELLTGRLPYDVKEKPIHVALRILVDEEPRPLTEHAPNLRGDLEHIVAKALEKDPDRRYSSVQALAEDIGRYQRGEPILARPGTTVYQLRKWVGRNRPLAGGIAATLLALVVGLVVALVLKHQSDLNAVRAEENAQAAKRSEELAVREREEARKKAEEVLQLSALQNLDDLNTKADGLWPVHPRIIRECEAWLEETWKLADRLPDYEAKLVELSSRATLASAGEGIDQALDRPRFTDSTDKWWHNQLGKLVAGVKALADPETGLASSATSSEHGWGIEKRLELAQAIAERSTSGAEASSAWASAVASIASLDECPRYGGLRISPQLGLLPIGRDPDSGLWEFAHLMTGEPAERGADGRLALAEETGLVFVLLPGGTFTMGAQAEDATAPNHDSYAENDEGPSVAVTLSPFFFSKYEMTQGQWLRFTGENPSLYNPKTYSRSLNTWKRPGDLLHPVEQVSWTDCVLICARLGLELPSEAQWEYGARAGTSTVWWTGDDRSELSEAGNISDAFAKQGGRGTDFDAYDTDVDDGNFAHARVGSYRANPFGLHDAIGNLWEWCQDGYHKYQPGSPLDPVWNMDDPSRITRGGSYDHPASKARSAFRGYYAIKAAEAHFGLRPCMRLMP